MGEKCSNTLIIHIEKALLFYNGAYATIMSCFASQHSQGIKFINREEDANSKGLRITKTSLYPIYLLKNTFVQITNPYFSQIKNNPIIPSSNLHIELFKDVDIDFYEKIVKNKEVNTYWGDDIKSDIHEEFLEGHITKDNGKEALLEYIKYLQNSELSYSFIISYNNTKIGEVVIYGYDFKGSAEVGVRLLEEYQHKGFGIEAFASANEYLIYTIGMYGVKVKCFKENLNSNKVLSKLYKFVKEDDTFFYFHNT